MDETPHLLRNRAKTRVKNGGKVRTFIVISLKVTFVLLVYIDTINVPYIANAKKVPS
ncbi:hypothetical protein ACOAJ8_08485 [Arcobacter cryaerophilus gv. pseudocryaerophilus]